MSAESRFALPSDDEVEAALAEWYGNVNWRWTFYRNGPDHTFALGGMRRALTAAYRLRAAMKDERT